MEKEECKNEKEESLWEEAESGDDDAIYLSSSGINNKKRWNLVWRNEKIKTEETGQLS